VESLLGEAEVSALETSAPVRKGLNFLSHCWIALKFLQEITEAVSLGEDAKSLLGEAEVSLIKTRVPVRKGHNF